MQVEVGSATAFTPYAESVTALPVDGHTLRSLPDGTRDEVTVDQYGHVILTQRVGEAVIDGTSILSRSITPSTGSGVGIRHNVGVLPNMRMPSSGSDVPPSINFRSDKLFPDRKALNSAQFVVGMAMVFQYSATANFMAVLPAECSTVAAGNTWLQSHPITVDYALATPVTHDLGTIDPTALVGPDMTAQAVPSAPFALTYERDMNATLARLEAAIAELATN